MNAFLLFENTASNTKYVIEKMPASIQTKILPTVVSGVLVFILGQLFLELIIKPLQKYKEIKSEIAFSLVYYADLYYNPVPSGMETKDPEREAARKELRKLAAKLTGFAEEKWLFNWPKLENIKEAETCLIGLANGMMSTHTNLQVTENEERVKKIKKLIDLKIVD